MTNILIVDIPTGPVFSTPKFLEYNNLVLAYQAKHQDNFFKKIGIIAGPSRSYSRGLLSIAAILEEVGAKVFYLNSDYTHNYQQACLEMIDKIDLLLASAKTNTYPLILNLLEKCKIQKPSLITILGGPHVTALPKECIQNKLIDIIVLGEGETTMRDLYSAIKHRKNLQNVAGIIYKEGNGNIRQTTSRSRIENLDDLPMPAYHLLPGGLNQFYIYLDTIRGCCYNCAFCSGPTYWQRKIKSRSVKNFLKELNYLEDHITDYNLIHLSDPMFGLTNKQKQILMALKKRKNKFYFSCDIKANYVLSDLIKKMSAANIKIFSIGIESANDKTLALINKQSTFEQEIMACKVIKAIKAVYLKSYWITGLPAETAESLSKQNELIYSLLREGVVDQICNHVLVPYPGTNLFNAPDKFGVQILHHDWIHYEGRSYPPVYRLRTLSEDEIYDYFLQSLLSTLKYYRCQFGPVKLTFLKPHKSNKISKKISFQETKGRLL